MAKLSAAPLVFRVQRCKPELVAPAKPTPHECKLLSDIDDQESLRFQIPIIQFYRYNPSMQGKDRAKLIKDALAQVLVFYYPFAGRLREGPNRKLIVDCTGEGALFIEAEADVTLDQFGDALQPQFPCFEELLYNVPGSDGIFCAKALLSAPLVFSVQRCEPELVAPARPTPQECKLLSDLDDQESLRCQVPIIQFYRYNPSMQGKDPARLIKDALAKTLVFYYPFAGRLREGPNHKHIVDCTGEGALFTEAALDQFGDTLQPPFPCFEELLFDVPGSNGMLNCPLVLLQVTRLKCGGFILGLRFNHFMCDAVGMTQFMSAMAEMARGAVSPSIPPVWERHLLDARNPPRVTFTHCEYDEIQGTITPLDQMVQRSFFFSSAQVSTLRRLLPDHLRMSSKFELLAACLWRCRTIALEPDPDEEVRLLCTVNVRSKLNPPLPSGYYGNAVVFTAAVTTARKLCQNPLGYAVELVKQAKDSVNEEYVKSVADLMVIRGKQLHYTMVRSWMISDVRPGFVDVDFGWGKAVYGGIAYAGIGAIPGALSPLIAFKNKKEEAGILMPIWLTAPAMERFAKEVDKMLKEQPTEGKGKSVSKSSAL